MWLEARLSRLADEFWEAQPYGPEPFPRGLLYSASLALPVVIHSLPSLSISNIKQWLHKRNIVDPITGANRRLRGCLLAYGGYGFVFVDRSDPEDERRFTIAHELAHFMLDYVEPRRRAIEALGEEIIPVLDSRRVPTRIEKMHAILDGVPLGLHVNMMERTGLGGYTSRATLVAEEQADRLAFELLAPADDAWATISVSPKGVDESYAKHLQSSIELLTEKYGLPEEQAREYASWLLKKRGKQSGVRDWLGIVE